MLSPENLAEANRQLELAVGHLESRAAQSGVNIFSARDAASVAHLLDRPDIVRRVEAMVAGLTTKDLYRNAITNVDVNKIAVRPIDLPGLAEAARSYPICTPAALLDNLRNMKRRSLQYCLRGDTSAAAKAATCERELEEIGSALAVMGRFEDAAAFIDSHTVEEFRRDGVRSVILLEKCRRQVPGIAEFIKQPESGYNGSLMVALALTLRLPWVGYPFADW